MDFLNIYGFDVPPGKTREFQAWVKENFDALAAAMPKGNQLLGIYATMFSSEKESGSFKIITRMDTYGAMDGFAAAAGQNTEFARLLEEFGSFGDNRLGANFSSELLKSVSDITIWSDNPEE
jgi:hypothetical protein